MTRPIDTTAHQGGGAQPPDKAATLWIRAGWLLDGHDAPARRQVLIGVRSGRIVHVGPDDRSHPAAADFSHATVLPALIDAHVHLVFSGTHDPPSRAAQLQHSPQAAATAIERHLLDHRRCGVSAVRDGGDRRGDVLQYKQHTPTSPDVHVKATCWAWHAQGRYGGMIGQAPPPGLAPAQAVARHATGCDHVKLIQSGLNRLDRFGHQGPPQFAADDLRAMVAAAHAAGCPVMVHANGEAAVRMAVEAGCDSIEHGYFMGDDNLRRLADRGIVWVPTAVPMAALSDAPGLTAPQRDVASRTLASQLEQIRKAGEWGVAMALGTDAGSLGVDHGHAVRAELALLIRAGLRLPRAVSCATRVAANLLGLADRGVLRPGRRADLIAVPGPPDQLPGSLAAIDGMCLGGHWVSG